jgi:hypothetical protein
MGGGGGWGGEGEGGTNMHGELERASLSVLKTSTDQARIFGLGGKLYSVTCSASIKATLTGRKL